MNIHAAYIATFEVTALLGRTRRVLEDTGREAHGRGRGPWEDGGGGGPQGVRGPRHGCTERSHNSQHGAAVSRFVYYEYEYEYEYVRTESKV